MTRYAQNGGLTRFDTGSTHEQNPLSGIPIGGNNSVEENETKQNNFVYSNRIFLDSNVVSQYNLPKSLIGKSVADATKFIDNKFKGRNDKISQSTKNGMLSKIAEAQEAMKPQEPEIEQEGIDVSQMALGGYVNKMAMGGDPTIITSDNNTQPGVIDDEINNNLKYGSMAAAISRPIGDNIYNNGDQQRNNNIQSINAIGTGVGSAIGGKSGGIISNAVTGTTGLYEMGSEAFGKSNVDTSGTTSIKGASAGKSAGSGALKGVGTGAAIGSIIPGVGTAIGAGVGALVGGITGFIGGKKDEKAQLKNNNKYSNRYNDQFSDTYALGGQMDPTKKITTDVLINTPIIENVKPSTQSDRFRYAVGEQGGVQHGASGEQGHYLYYDKKPGDSGFNPNIHREFVNQSGYDTYMKSAQGQQYRRNLQLQPKQMADGGYYDKNKPYFMTNPGPTSINSTIGKTGFYGPDILPKQIFNDSSEPINIPEREIIPTQTQAQFENYANQAYPNKPSFGQKVGKTINDNAGNIARYAPIAANAYQLSQLKKPQGERLDRLSNRYKPEYVDEAALQNIADQTMNNTIGAISQSGASQGQTRASILGSQLQRTKAISDAYSQAAAQNRATNDRAQTFNLGVDQVNLQQSNVEKENFARDSAAYRNAKREYITGIGEGIGDIGKEQTYKKIIAKTTGYKWDGEYVKSSDGTVVTDPLTGKPMTEEKLKELQSTKDKKALGGYLIKNKRQ